MPLNSSPTPWGGEPKSLAPSVPRGRTQLQMSSSSRFNKVPEGIAQWNRGPRRPQPSSDNAPSTDFSTQRSKLGMGKQGTPARARVNKTKSVGMSSTPKGAVDTSPGDSDDGDLSYPDETRSVNMDDDPFALSADTIEDASAAPSFRPSTNDRNRESSPWSSYQDRYVQAVVPANIPPSSSQEGEVPGSTPPFDDSLVTHRMRMYNRSREWDKRMPQIVDNSPVLSTAWPSPVQQMPPSSPESPMRNLPRRVPPAAFTSLPADKSNEAILASLPGTSTFVSLPNDSGGSTLNDMVFIPPSSGIPVNGSQITLASIDLSLTQQTSQQHSGQPGSTTQGSSSRQREREKSSFNFNNWQKNKARGTGNPIPSGPRKLGRSWNEFSLVSSDQGHETAEDEVFSIRKSRSHQLNAAFEHEEPGRERDDSQSDEADEIGSWETQRRHSPGVPRGERRSSAGRQSDSHDGHMPRDCDEERWSDEYNDYHMDIPQPPLGYSMSGSVPNSQSSSGPPAMFLASNTALSSRRDLSRHDSPDSICQDPAIASSDMRSGERQNQRHHNNGFDEDVDVDPWGYFTIWKLAREASPQPYRPSSEYSTSQPRQRRKATASPLVFSSTPSPQSSPPPGPTARGHRLPAAPSTLSAKRKKVWRGARVLDRMEGRAPPRRETPDVTETTSESEAETAPRKKPTFVERPLNESSRRARQARIDHYKDLDDNYELHFG